MTRVFIRASSGKNQDECWQDRSHSLLYLNLGSDTPSLFVTSLLIRDKSLGPVHTQRRDYTRTWILGSGDHWATLAVWLPQGGAWPDSHSSDCLKARFLGPLPLPPSSLIFVHRWKLKAHSAWSLWVQIPKRSYITKSGFWEMLCYKSCLGEKINRNYQKEETTRRPFGAR